MLLQLLLFTATAGSAAALAPHTRRFVAGRMRDSAAKPPRRRRVTCRVLDDEAIGLDLEALGADLGALDDAASLDLDALVAGAGDEVLESGGVERPEVAEGLEVEPDRLVVEHAARHAAAPRRFRCAVARAARVETPRIWCQRRPAPSGSSPEQQLQEHYARSAR